MDGSLAHFHVQLIQKKKCLVLDFNFFFRENIILYFSQLQPDPENNDIGTLLILGCKSYRIFFSIWADDFFFFLVYSSCLFTFFSWNQFHEKKFFQKFVVRYRLCFVSQLWNSHMILHIARANIFFHGIFFIYILVQFFCLFNFWWASSTKDLKNFNFLIESAEDR